MRVSFATIVLALVLIGPAFAASAGPVVAGRVMQDWMAWASVDDALSEHFGADFGDGTEFRRARICVYGELYEHLEYRANYEFADGDAAFKDVYMDVTEIPFAGTVRIGRTMEPFGLDQLTSSKYITFMERSLLTAFVPSYSSGFMVRNGYADGAVRIEAGVFRRTDDYGEAESDDGRYSVTARIVGLPYRHVERDALLHLGFAVSHRNPEGHEVRYRERPEVHMSPCRFVDTEEVPADNVLLLGGELLFILGPFHAQGEYMTASIASPRAEAGEPARDATDPSFSGYSIQASYMLTGESRPYTEGALSRVKPRSSFLEDGGLGAWEIAARYSRLDLNDEDGGVLGGRVADVTIGLNWYLHSHARLMVNYVHSTVFDGDRDEVGAAAALMTRVQFDF